MTASLDGTSGCEEFQTLWRTSGLDAREALAFGETVRAEALLGSAATLASGDTLVASAGAGGSDLVILRRLGEGAMGAVDLARQRSLQREVAVKRLRDGARDERALAALLNEALVVGSLEHPGIVPVHALSRDDAGLPMLVMKRVEGVVWSELVANPGHPLWSTLAPDAHDRVGAHVEILRQVCNALEFAHARGVIHRDIKPDNVMIGSFGEVYLLDWGVALRPAALTEREREARQVVGTPSFMAPEMFAGRVGAIDERSDVYLLGATLHWVLTGTDRHRGETLQAVLLAAWSSAPVAYPPAVPDELAALCNAATAREPSERPQSVAAFRQQLQAYVRRRSSVALARTARASLEAAQSLERVSVAGGGSDGQAAEVISHEAFRLLSEARFGYVQALREWPGNAQAREGLERCLASLAEREIALRSPESARAFLDEMRAAPAHLRARLAELTARLDAERAAAERARAEAREADKSRSAPMRALLLAVGVSASVLIGVLGHQRERSTGRAQSAWETLQGDLALFLVVAVVMVLARRRLFGNRISRQLTLTLVAMFLASTLSDLAAIRQGMPEVAATTHRFAVIAGSLGVGAVTVERTLLVPAAAAALALVLIVAWPPLLHPASTVAVAISAVSLIRTAWRQRSPSQDAR